MRGNCKYFDVIFNEIIKHFGFPETIVELGCGSGKNLAKFSCVKLAIGIDPLLENILKAQRIKGNFQFILGDHEYLKHFETNQFEVGFTCSVLDHIEDFRSALNEMCRICQNVILFEPIIKGQSRQAKQCETNCWKTSWYHDYSSWLVKVGLEFSCKSYLLYSKNSGPYFHQIVIDSKNYLGQE